MGLSSSGNRSKKKEIQNYISWFEIPAVNFDQAVMFYNQIFDFNMETMSSNGYAMAFFPSKNGAGGAIVTGPGSVPGESGPLIYLNCGENLSKVLDKVEAAGGRIIMPKTHINDQSGYFAIFIDTEGNKLALHSTK